MTKVVRSLLTVSAIAMTVASVSPALAQSTKQRVRDLEANVAELRARMDGQTAAARIDALEGQVRELTGEVERLTFELNRSKARLDAVTSILANDPDAAGAIASAAALGAAPISEPGGEPAQLTPGGDDPIADQITSAQPAPTDVQLPIDSEAAFEYSLQFLLKGDYSRARVALEQYVKVFPNSVRTPDAQFRLGEIYLATSEDALAADTFLAHIRKYPNDPRSATAYLKLGTAFARLKETDEACKIFRAIGLKFPNATPAILQRARIEADRIKCSA